MGSIPVQACIFSGFFVSTVFFYLHIILALPAVQIYDYFIYSYSLIKSVAKEATLGILKISITFFFLEVLEVVEDSVRTVL